MEDKFIWNIDQDTIHFVNSFNFEEPLEDDYITGEYLAPDKSIVLYLDNVKIPINIDYFIRLWKSSEPDKELIRENVELIRTSSFQRTSTSKFSINEKEIFDLFITLSEEKGMPQAISIQYLLGFIRSNPSIEEIKSFFKPVIVTYNKKVLNDLYPQNFPQKPEEWKNLSEEEVFAYVEVLAKNISKERNIDEQIIIDQLMDKWNQTGVPVDIKDRIIDEALIDWNEVKNQMKTSKKSKWVKKSEHQGMTNWETWNTDVTMENDYELSQFFYGLIARNASIEDFANEAIKKVVGPHNKDLLEQFDAISDEEEIEMKMQSDLENWQYDAKRRHPNDPEAQQEYVDKMKEIVYGLMGEPEPTDIANHWIDEAKINWQEIYNKWKSNWEAEQNYRESKWQKV